MISPTGFEPAILRFVVSRLIRWATGTNLMYWQKSRIAATPAGFEPARMESNSLAGCRLNHSAKVSEY